MTPQQSETLALRQARSTRSECSERHTVTLSGGQIRVANLTVYGKTPCEHTNASDKPTNIGDGKHAVICPDCGETLSKEAHTSALECEKCDYVAPLQFSSWSLTLEDNLAINFALDANLFTSGLYANPKVTFTIGNRVIEVTEYNTEKQEGYYTFTLTDVAPHQIGVTVSVVLSATKGEETVTKSFAKTIKQYCAQVLADSNSTDKVKTLIVDLLNYGAASQTYVGATDAPVNADLTEEQKAFGTQGAPVLNNHANKEYQTIENAIVTWYGASLYLADSVHMQFVFKAESVEGLTVKVTTKDPADANATGKTYTIKNFTTSQDGYVATFDVFSAAQMSEIVYVTVCDADGNVVSDTFRYSIESYAYAKQNDGTLGNLVKAMMNYGNAAKAYIA